MSAELQLLEREQMLVEMYPWISWTEPQPARVIGGAERLTCRFCTALHGLKAAHLHHLGFESEEQFREHLQAVHAHPTNGRPA